MSLAIATSSSSSSTAPPYGRRKGWVPRTQEDFGDGGAFPEVALPQYPLNMGKPGLKAGSGGHSGTVALQTGGDGKIAYDAIAKQGRSGDKLAVYTRPDSMREKWSKSDALVGANSPNRERIERIRAGDLLSLCVLWSCLCM